MPNQSKINDPRFWKRWRRSGAIQDWSNGFSTDGPTPPPCNPDIFKNGEPVVTLYARSNAAERWVRAVAKKAKASLDWHYFGGIAQVLHLGDEESGARVEAAITELADTLDGTIMRRYVGGESGLYRRGVTERPSDAIAMFMHPVTGRVLHLIQPSRTV